MSNSDPFTSLAGAVGAPPEHYGNLLGEQQRLATGEAVVDLSDRAVLAITGEDRLTWLDSLTSQSIAKLAPGESAETLLLDPTGRLDWRAYWPIPHEAVDVPGDHFTILEEHSETTVIAVREWIDSLI